ncbi:hypothetical protein ACFVAV_35350 [Nocardia sp. NPDC057663]|uniref:hypothetical protein n=1 Tax=Nocardia sp. NPDC057663 TaxID=3346201 RepID=UPI00366EFF0A
MLAEGVTRLGLARVTVRRFARAESPEELLVNNRTGYRTGLLDEFKPYLYQRWNDGCTNAARLFEEIRERGYRGRASMVRAYLQPFRATAHIPAPPPKPPTVREVTAWNMTHPANIDPDDQRRPDAILDASPELESVAGHDRAFATTMTERRGREFEQWMTSVDSDKSCGLALLRPRLAQRSGRGHRWPHYPPEQRDGRRPCQPDQDVEAADVRTCEAGPYSEANPAEQLTNT